MALRYFGAKVSNIIVGIKHSTNSGYLPKIGPSNFITDQDLDNQRGISILRKWSTLGVYSLTYIHVRLDLVINYSSTIPRLRVDLVTFPLRHLVSEE